MIKRRLGMATKISKSQPRRASIITKAKKKKVPQTIAVGFVLDGSGSMQSVKKVTIDGCNQFLDKIRNDKESHYLFGLSIFHSGGVNGSVIIDQRYSLTELKHVGDFTDENYKPEGGTPLYDAIGTAVRRLEAAKADKFLVVFMTDGEENAYSEWTLEHLKGLIHDKEALGNWTFLFLSSELTAKTVGLSMGIHVGNIAHYDRLNVGIAAASMGAATMCYSASSAPASKSFFTENKVEGVDQHWEDDLVKTTTTSN
jgi:hypothetical protein